MVSISQIQPHDTIRRIHRVQTITIIWMSIEAAVSLLAAWIARSPALLGFGGDSAIELLSAVVVLWRFKTLNGRDGAEKRAARITGALLFMLAAYVVGIAVTTLLGHTDPKPSYLGIAILIGALTIMPWLAAQKQGLSAATGSAALRADAAQSSLCAYLSLVALLGLLINALWHVPWADPVAALALTPLILWEGSQTIRGKACGCC